MRRSVLCGIVCLALVGQITAVGARADEPDDELVQMVLGLLEESDKDLRALGLDQVRTAAPGESATRRFAAQLAKTPAAAQPGLLSALADRGDAAALPTVRENLETSRDPAVRQAALLAVGKLGGVADLDLLLKSLVSEDAAERSAAQVALSQLRGEETPRALANRLDRGDLELRRALLDVLVNRRAHGACPQILPLAVDTQPALRRAAMQALAQLARGEHLSGMLQGVLTAVAGEEREAAEKAVMVACQRIDEAGERGRVLLAAFESQPLRDHPVLLPTLGRVGGEATLGIVEAALANPAQRDAGLRAICNWPDASVAPRLIELLKSDQDPQRRSMTLLALVRVAPLPDGRADDERLELLRTVFGLCKRTEDKALVVKRARAVRTIETLRFVLPLVQQPGLAEPACETVVELAHHRNLREPNKAEFDGALDKVLAVSRDATTRDRAQRYKKNQTWVRPKS